MKGEQSERALAGDAEVFALTADPALRDMVTALYPISSRQIATPQARAAIIEVAARRGVHATNSTTLIEAFTTVHTLMGLPIPHAKT